MNVSISIEKLIPKQIINHYEELYNKVYQSDTGDQFINLYGILTPLEVYKKDAAGQCSALEYLCTSLNEMDQEDYFGTEGWKHRFGME